MEPLTQTIDLAGPKGLLWKRLEASGDWAIRFRANAGVVFSYIVAGACVVVTEQNQDVLHPGDFLMLVHPGDWRLGNDASTPAIDYDSRRHPTSGRLLNGEGPVTSTFGGHFAFDALNGALIEALLPPLTLIRGSGRNSERVRALLDLLGDEARADRAGRNFVLEHLLKLLLVEAIRQPQMSLAATQPNLVRGLGEPRIARALQAMHADIARRWTVQDLARLAGMSRSSFAAHFATTVGMAPIDYLLNWRMALAKDALRNKRRKLADVARMTGYDSASAFSAAFTRQVGSPPSRFAAGRDIPTY